MIARGVFLRRPLAGLALPLAGLALISVPDEIAIGRHAQAQVRREVPELRDPEVRAYVSAVGARLAARARGARYPYSFSVANQREINAFALPGGPVWVHRGAMAAARTEAQFAGVLAHEIAHISERHAATKLTASLGTNVLLGLLGALLGSGPSSQTARAAAAVLASGASLKFSRDDERDADRVGAEILSRSGWDARGMVEFMQILREKETRDPGLVAHFFSSHPSTADRIVLLRRTTARLGRGTRDTPAFQKIRRRLAQLPPPRSVKR